MTKLPLTPLRYVLPLMLVYGVVLLIGILHHELFLEEAQQLTIARDSASIAGVYHNMLYEGHVTLWNTLLYLVTHYTSAKPIYMQLFHALVICSAAFVFVRYAPFSLSVKTLILFGCYFLYVYSIISRNYALGILFLFVCCVLLANPAKNLIGIGVVLVLLCLTHLFYAFAAMAFYAYLLLYIAGKKQLYKRFGILMAMFLIGITCAFVQSSRIPADSILHAEPGLHWLNLHNMAFGLKCFARGYITLPPVNQPYFWDRQFIEYLPGPVNSVFTVLLLAGTILLVCKSRKALVFYVISIGLLTAFFTLSRVAGSRYFGLLFMFFMAAMWLAYYDGVTLVPQNISPAKRLAIQVAIYLILINQVFTGVYLYVSDYARPFSQAKNTIQYIRSQHLDTQTIVIDGYNAGPPLSAYIGHPVYYLDIGQPGSFCIWKVAYLPNPRHTLQQELAASRYIATLRSFILISNRPAPVNNSTGFTSTQLAAFTGSIIKGEDYYVYKLSRR